MGANESACGLIWYAARLLEKGSGPVTIDDPGWRMLLQLPDASALSLLMSSWRSFATSSSMLCRSVMLVNWEDWEVSARGRLVEPSGAAWLPAAKRRSRGLAMLGSALMPASRWLVDLERAGGEAARGTIS